MNYSITNSVDLCKGMNVYAAGKPAKSCKNEAQLIGYQRAAMRQHKQDVASGDWGFRQYLAGQRKYAAGAFLDDCVNAEQERGWWDALNYDAQMQAEEAQAEYTDWRT